MSDLKPEERERYLTLLKERSNRLTNFVKLKAPDTVIADAIGLVLYTGLLLYGSPVLNLLAQHVLSDTRFRQGRCVDCGAEAPQSELKVYKELCDECERDQQEFNRDNPFPEDGALPDS